VESLADENVTTANLVCTQLHADDLLKMVAYSFGVDPGVVEKGELLQRLQALLHKWHREDRRALLIVDEAQDLSTSAMEELRLLTNIQLNGTPLLQIFLLGQPELRELILSPKLEQVHQRVVAASHLQALECEETEAYIRHRLETVGWQGDPALSKVIFPLIHRFSEGIPRRINLICSRLFLHGAVEQKHRIGVKDMKDVIAELQSESLAAGQSLSDFDFNIDDVYEETAPKAALDAPTKPPAPLVSVPASTEEPPSEPLEKKNIKWY
jgi:general secretion pathway protein A